MTDEAALAVNVVLAVTSVISAVVAVWQAILAKRSKTEAKTSLESALRAAAASERQAAAAEKSLRLQEEMLQPDPWSARHIGGDTYACVNNSERLMQVTSLVASPKGNSVYWSHVAADKRYEPGDRFEFMFSKVDPNRPHKIVIEWNYEGETETRRWTLSL